MQRQVVKEERQRGELVRHVLGRVEVAGVEKHAGAPAVARCPALVELLVSHRKALDANAKDLLLEGVHHVRRGLGIDAVKHVHQVLAQAIAVGWGVLQAVGNPEVEKDLVV